MRPTDYIASLFKPSGGPGGESAAYDFDPIGSYFYNCPAEEGVFQIVDAETTADLDLNAVFEKIDRTTSRVGQQYLYARLRTLRGEEDAADFDRRVGAFENDDELTQRCAGHLARLAGDDAYDLCRLIFDTPVRVRRIGLIYALTAAATAALLLAPFYPALLLLFVAIYAVNMYIHYSNKINISLYTSAVKQLSTALKTARYLAAEGVPGSDEAARPIRRVAEVEHRSRIVGTQGDGGNELAAVGWLAFELVKIAFNIEVILFHRFTGSIATHRDAIHDVFRFIGRTDAAISVMRLRRAAKTCRPTFTDGKYLEAVQVVHPLIEGCTANTLTLDGRNLEHTDSKCLRWETDDATHIVTVGNPSYEGLTHRRTVWFVDRQFFVIADEASGTAEGEVGLHYNLVECDPAEDFAACSAATRFSDGNNLLLKVFGAERMERREGWVSRTYRQRTERPAYAFTVRKRAGKPVRLVTVLLPAEDAAAQRVEAVWRGNRLQVKINGTKYNLK